MAFSDDTDPSDTRKSIEKTGRPHENAESASPSQRSRLQVGRYLLLGAWTALAAATYGVYSGALPVPAQYNPWAPLDVRAAPGFLTSYKLARASADPGLCMQALADSGMSYDELPDRVTGSGCGFENAVRLRSAGVRFGAPLSLSCPMALSFAMWERHVLQPAAEVRLHQRIVAIDQLGSYACRNINTGEAATPGRGARSQHATANALDVSGFTLADGKSISVLKNWESQNDSGEVGAQRSPQGLLLADLHAGACKYFKGVLGPDYNAVHQNHFHLETGGYSMCR